MKPTMQAHHTQQRSWHICLHWLTTLLFILPLAACNAQSDTNQPAPETKPADGSRVGLAMVAYNYTDRYIDTYSVNGNGGGMCL